MSLPISEKAEILIKRVKYVYDHGELTTCREPNTSVKRNIVTIVAMILHTPMSRVALPFSSVWNQRLLLNMCWDCLQLENWRKHNFLYVSTTIVEERLYQIIPQVLQGAPLYESVPRKMNFIPANNRKVMSIFTLTYINGYFFFLICAKIKKILIFIYPVSIEMYVL